MVYIACLCVVSARDEGRGQAAVAELQKEGLQPKFHQLDILSTDSINKLHAFLKGNYAGLDILVNNAGMAYKVRHEVLVIIINDDNDDNDNDNKMIIIIMIKIMIMIVIIIMMMIIIMIMITIVMIIMMIIVIIVITKIIFIIRI